jgi:predicted DNA binding CopG/RHH family protein
MTYKTYTSKELEKMQKQGLSKTNWQAVDNQPIQNDIGEEFDFENAHLIYPKTKSKKQIAFRIEPELLEFLKQHAIEKNMRGYQSLMHAILETYKQQQTHL